MPQINPTMAARIRAREAEALARGWAFQDIWEAQFWNVGPGGRNRPGLAALMNPGDSLGTITEDCIEIIRRSGVMQRFYRPDRPQPWIKGDGHGPTGT